MLQYLASGIILGLSAGMAPGPILALVITETLKHSMKEGIKVSLVPLITDFPIIVLSLLLVGQLARFESVLGLISIAGSLFVLYLAYESFQSINTSIHPSDETPRSLQKGVLANLLNPHPYLFWITVGAPLILKATEMSTAVAAAF
ncbi:MAG TPA: LysE family transporter, partial [bacterium]|nr:LysE family transporter [bacterium]